MPLEYAAAAPPSGPVRKPDFRAGSLTKAFAGDFLDEVEPGRGASGARPAQSPVYASRAAGGKGAATDYKGCTTLFETFDRAVREFGDRPALGRRPVGPDGKAGPYEWMTYRKVGEYAAAIGSAMVGGGYGDSDGGDGTGNLCEMVNEEFVAESSLPQQRMQRKQKKRQRRKWRRACKLIRDTTGRRLCKWRRRQRQRSGG